jgi:4-diphosphocytidyl-2-C-methyl-D-erythritol kinase
MGGGSSDAASTLLALNRLWGLHWPRERLMAIGLTLGADVPFFIGGRNAFVEGIGERLTPTNLPRQAFAVVKPAASVETRLIFASPLLVRDTKAVIVEGFRTDEQNTTPASRQVRQETWQEAWQLRGFGRNDMQRPAEAVCPEVAQAAQWLQERFDNSRMTGSGSAVFARVDEDKFAFGADGLPKATIPADLPPGWAGRLCWSLQQHPLAGWAVD